MTKCHKLREKPVKTIKSLPVTPLVGRLDVDAHRGAERAPGDGAHALQEGRPASDAK